jgi:membrane-associated phospholipid phosphatase
VRRLGTRTLAGLTAALALTVGAPARAQPAGSAVQSSGTGGPASPSSSTARAEDPSPQLQWKWREFGLGDWIVSGTGLATLIIAGAIGPNEQAPNRGAVLLDDEVRSSLRARSRRGQHAAQDASDVFLAINSAYPLLVDAMAVAWIYRDSPEVAKQMALINVEVYAVTSALTTLAKISASRQRPYVPRCGETIATDTADCETSSRFQSFFSGHTSQSFSAAAVTCMHHAYLPLHGDGPANAVPCATGLSFAALAGLGRIIGDVHYWSDVMAGALVGTGVGLFIPWLHYGFPDRTPDSEGSQQSGLRWRIVPNGPGLAVTGVF